MVTESKGKNRAAASRMDMSMMFTCKIESLPYTQGVGGVVFLLALSPVASLSDSWIR